MIAPAVDQAACRLANKWGLDMGFAVRVARVREQFEREVGASLRIISGYRTPERQEELIEEGVGTAVSLSLHTMCPFAHAVDVWPNIVPVASVRATLGRIVVFNGLRWGGCDGSVPGCISPVTFMPVDWNHIDSGRRGTF